MPIGDRYGKGEQQGEDAERQGQHQALADQLGDGLLPVQRDAEIALENSRDPFEILDIHRLVEAVETPQGLDLHLIHRRARGGELGHVAGHEVAGRRLNQDERHDREDEQQHRQQQEPLDDVDQHQPSTAGIGFSAPPIGPLPGRSGRARWGVAAIARRNTAPVGYCRACAKASRCRRSPARCGAWHSSRSRPAPSASGRPCRSHRHCRSRS